MRDIHGRKSKGAIIVPILTCLITTVAAVLSTGLGVAVAQDDPWPKRVLITNDNGIEDVATQALARGFAKIADVVLVASSEDRTGASSAMTFTRTGKFVVERRDMGEGVRAWALDGYPADCVLFAVAGPMADAPPDLVVSGINGGANASDEWFGSGTVGAARTAAFVGIPAIAVSGIDDDDPDAIAAAVDWVLRLARSGIMRRVRPPSYLTVSLPVGPPSEITGVEVVDRARGILGVTAKVDPAAKGAIAGKETWSASIETRGQPGAESDLAAMARGRIAVVPMRVGDADPELLEWLRANGDVLPGWRPASTNPEALQTPPNPVRQPTPPGQAP